MIIPPDIVTVTLNPAIDETLFLDDFKLGAVNRAHLHHRQAGGKGVNISSMLAQYGIASVATGFMGDDNPQLFEKLFSECGVVDGFVRIKGETRSGIKIINLSNKSTTDINFPGAAPAERDLAELVEKLRGCIVPGRWFILAGSLPAGVTPGYFGKLIGLLKTGGAKVAVDTHGPALKAAIASGVDLIKPNHHELADILDVELTSDAEHYAAAIRIQRECVPHVILSMGKDGAFFANPDGCFTAGPAPVDVVTTVGAGDAMLAGYLAGLITGRSACERSALATVFSWSALEDLNRRLPSRDDIERRVQRIKVGLFNFS